MINRKVFRLCNSYRWRGRFWLAALVAPALSGSRYSVLFVSIRELVPHDLAGIAPGPELARVLAGVELSGLSGYDCVEILKAQYRQSNHERARVLAAMVEVGMRSGSDDLSRIAPDEFSADEIRAALMLTRRAAEGQFWLAHDLLMRLPEVHAAMDTGELDEPRARVLSEWTAGLSDDQARAVCTRLLTRVGKLTTGQLIEQIKKFAIAVDPDWARRRYEQAIAERKVVGYRNADGSANLSGCNLPLDRVAAASGHIDGLAKAAKRAGDPRPLDHVRADLFLGMTDGTYAGLDDAAIIELLTAAVAPPADPPSASSAGQPRADQPRADQPSDDQPSDDGGDQDPSAGDSVPDDGSEPDDGDAAGAGQTSSALRNGAAQPVRLGRGMELRVRLSTLLGLNQYPAELAGWGYLHANWPVTSPPPSVVHSGASRSPTITVNSSTPGSPLRGPPAPPPALLPAGPSWNCRYPSSSSRP